MENVLDEAVDIAVEEVDRRTHKNLIIRQLRDSSNPFNLPNETLKQHYRLERNVAHDVFLQIQPDLDIGIRRTKTPTVIQFFSALHFFANGSYQKSVGNDFICPLSQPAVSRALHNVVTAIVNRLHRHVKFPQRNEDILEVKNGFFQKFHMPGIIGAVDCTHISIVPPSMGNEAYPRVVFVNRKNFCSLNCQIICDSDLKILNINARFPGSVHDAAIWSLSDIRLCLRQKYHRGERNFWLLGDSGYPLRPYLMTPILHALPGSPESRYTEVHCRARNTIERCIGALKGRFRCLRRDRVLHYKPEFASSIVYACAILQNIMRAANIDDDDIIVEDDILNDDMEDDEPDGLQQGLEVQQHLIREYFN